MANEEKRTDECRDGWHYPNGCRADSSGICGCPCHDRNTHDYKLYSTNDEGLCQALGIVSEAMYALADAMDRSAGLKRPVRS